MSCTRLQLLRSFKYCLWHQFFWSTVQDEKIFQTNMPSAQFCQSWPGNLDVADGCIHGFCNTKKNPQCTGGTFCQSLGRKPSFLFLDQPTPTVPLPLISKSCLTCIKICDLDEEFACILHVRQ